MQGFLYEGYTLTNILGALMVLFGLLLFNELGRRSKWIGLFLFALVPIVLTIFVWPTTAAPGNEYGTGNWFNWVKTYSALAGCLGFMAIRYIPSLAKNKWALMFPPAILAINILEAVLRDFQIYGMGLVDGGVVDHLWTMSGPWNIMNGVAGILNILTICGWAGIVISNRKSKDMLWPDMIWIWIIAYDIWNFSYTYNCISDHSFYSGVILLLSCTIPAFFIRKGAWLQHRASTLALWIMFIMTVPQFADSAEFKISTTHNPDAFMAVAALSLAVNAGLAIYQLYRIIKLRKNPLKDELYKGTAAYESALQ